MRWNCPLSRISQNSTDNFLSLIFFKPDLFLFWNIGNIFSLFSIFRYVYCRWPPRRSQKMQFNNKTSRVVSLIIIHQFLRNFTQYNGFCNSCVSKFDDNNMKTLFENWGNPTETSTRNYRANFLFWVLWGYHISIGRRIRKILGDGILLA